MHTTTCFKYLTVFAVASMPLMARAQERFLLDIGQATRQMAATDTQGRHWNNFTQPTAPSTAVTTLVNTAGVNTSGVTFAVTDGFAFSSLNGHQSKVAIYPYEGSSDFWAVQNNPGKDARGTVRIGGLDTTGTKVYDITIFASSSRATPQKLIGDYTVKGFTSETKSLEAVGNINNTITISGIQPDHRGNIYITTDVNPASYSTASESYAVLGVLDIQSRLESRPPVVAPVFSSLGDTPNPPEEVSPTNPKGLTAYVLEAKDSYTNRVGLGELLRRAGFNVKPLPLDAPPFNNAPGANFEDDVDLVAIGSFASDDPDYQAYMAQYGDVLDDYVDRAGLLIQFTQADQTESKPPFLPDTQDASRNDADFTKALILEKQHLMMQGLPTVDNGNAVQFTIWDEPTSAHTDNTLWETYFQFFGFNVILSGDNRARTPGFMEGAYGQGRFFLSAMANDKILDPETGELTETPSLRAFNDVFFANLYNYADLVRSRSTPAIEITPQPGSSTIEDGAWSIVLLPDTQIYSQNYPGMFEAQTSWIADNIRERNIKFVLHLGDITNVNSLSEWKFARKAMGNLDGIMPYAFATGNHDYGPGGNAATRDTLLNDHFKVSQYQDWPTFGGVKDAGKMDNTYHLFSAGGVDFIVLSLEWAVQDATVEWAQSILDQHPDRTAILLTHAYMNNNDFRYDHTDTTRPQTYNPHDYSTPGLKNDGEQLWNKLVKKNNFAFTFNGHVLGDGTGFRIDNNDGGKPVAQMLANYQMRNLGGEAYLRILEFQPDGKTVKVTSHSPVYNNFLTAADQDFSFEVPLGAADVDGDGILDYYDEDFDDDNDGINNYLEHSVYGTSSKTADTDGDGISDAAEIAAGTNPTRNDSREFNAVKENRDALGLYTREDIMDVRPAPMLIDVQNGRVKLDFQLEQSENLIQWAPAGEKVEWDFPADSGKRLFRLNMATPAATN